MRARLPVPLFHGWPIPAHNVAQQFPLHSNKKQAHADRIAARIIELGGTPDFSPDGLSCRSHAQYVEAANLIEMISGLKRRFPLS